MPRHDAVRASQRRPVGKGTSPTHHLSAIDIFAVFGWLDVSFRGDALADSSMMHCLPDFSAACSVAEDSWTCARDDGICDAPPT